MGAVTEGEGGRIAEVTYVVLRREGRMRASLCLVAESNLPQKGD
jgi:hypothetical protein